MAGKYTEAQKRASLAYQQDKAQIKLTVTKEMRAKYQNHAKSKNMTLTGLIIELLEADMHVSDSDTEEGDE